MSVLDRIQEQLEVIAETAHRRGIATQSGEPLIDQIEQEFAEWVVGRFEAETEQYIGPVRYLPVVKRKSLPGTTDEMEVIDDAYGNG